MREIDGVGRALDILIEYSRNGVIDNIGDTRLVWAVEKAVEVMEEYMENEVLNL